MARSVSNNDHMKKGFTLVEIIVAMMIFSIVAVVALAALIKIIDANKKAQTTQDAVTNLSFALEAMSREMRSGSAYYCNTQNVGPTLNLWNDTNGPRYVQANNCSGALNPGSGSQAIIFAYTSPSVITTGSGNPCHPVYAYRLRRPDSVSVWYLEKSEQTTCVITGSVRSSLQAGFVQSAQDTFLPITSTSTSLTNFYVKMSSDPFPLLTLALSGNAGVKEQSKSYFTVQTSSSPRVP